MQATINGDQVFLALIVLVALYFSAIVALTNKLQRYPEAWKQTGEFSLITNNSVRTGTLFLKFIFSRSYQTLNDRSVTLMVWTVRALLVAGLILLAWDMISMPK